MMDFLLAIVLLFPRHDAPLRIAPGTVQTIPQPLPYVIDETVWGAS